MQIQDAIDEVTAQIVKYQIVFKDGAPKELYERNDICHMSNIGSVYTIVLQEQNDKFEEDMKGLGASLVEEMPVGLEESFIYMNQKGNHLGGGARNE